MYNLYMPTESFEIRLCNSCGLRYPLLIMGNSLGRRCPSCSGETVIILTQNLVFESSQALPVKISRSSSQYTVLMDNIRSAWNVGSNFRSADGFGFKHAFLCGITPTPDNPGVRKTSLGAELTITWSYHKNAVTLAKELGNKGHRIIALEEGGRSVNVSTIAKRGNTVLIIGNENSGIDPELLDLSEKIFHIPMMGRKKSLNVATAFSIAAYLLSSNKLLL